jgi:methionine-rich copper-binding protein CopC
MLAVTSSAMLVAHMQVEKTSPADKATLTSAPKQVQLWFSAAPTLAVSHVTLTGPAGKIALGTLALGKAGDTMDNSVVADVKGPLAAGTYTVTWRTSGSDGHMLNGSFTFTLKSQ